MNIGENIRKYRKQNKLTQKEFGELIGKKEITIRRYEKGDIVPPIEVIQNISNILDIPITSLVDNKTPMIYIEPLSQYSTEELLEEIIRRCK